MNCRELVALVTDYLEGRLAAGDRERFEAHLEICADCRAYVEQMRGTVAALGRLPDEARLSAGVRDELLRAFGTWRSPS
jgi:anti-sigma factor RsiW